MYQSKSAEDISMQFTVLYFVGLTLQAVYFSMIRAWAGAIPICFEALLAFMLLAGKIYLDHSTVDTANNNVKTQQQRQEAMPTEGVDLDPPVQISHDIENLAENDNKE
jgi:hypothetical protein